MSNPNQLNIAEQFRQKQEIPSYLEGYIKDDVENFLSKDEGMTIEAGVKDDLDIIRFVLAPNQNNNEENSVGLLPFIDEDNTKAYKLAINDVILGDHIIKPNQQVEQQMGAIGREHFAYNSQKQYVSLYHLQLSYGNGYIKAINLGRNGTKVEKYTLNSDISAETEDLIEYQEDMNLFEVFTKRNEDYLMSLNTFSAIGDYILSNFCMNRQQDESLIDNNQFQSVSRKALNETKNYLNRYKIYEEKSEYWTGVTVGDFNRNAHHGRIYLNPKNTEMVNVYNDIVKLLTLNGNEFQIKMPKIMERSSYNRSDKVVLYFELENALSIKDLLVQYLEQNNEKMNRNVPIFTKKLETVDGKVLNGVSFAENPTNRQVSYNRQISNILAGTYAKNITQGNFLAKDSEVVDTFSGLCKNFGVDPHKPYKNINSQFTMF